MASETRAGDVPLYGEGGDEAASMAEAANRAGAPGTAEKPGRRVAGKTGTGEPVPEQAPREQHGAADRRPSQA